jgi:hypothetical protein
MLYDFRTAKVSIFRVIPKQFPEKIAFIPVNALLMRLFSRGLKIKFRNSMSFLCLFPATQRLKYHFPAGWRHQASSG